MAYARGKHPNSQRNLTYRIPVGSIPWNKSKSLSPQTREKLRLSHLGKKNNLGKHWKIKDTSRMSAAQKALWASGRRVYKSYGPRSGNWKGGISRAYKTGYNSPQYRAWRKAVFERDSHTCQDCGAKGVYITAHHIKSFAYFPDLRFDIDNGRTLCEPCHEKTDNYKGRARRLKANA